MSCPFESQCWLYSYSRYQKEIGFTEITTPTRQELLLKGYANSSMMPKSLTPTKRTRCEGLFCKVIPSSDRSTWCHSLRGLDHTRCAEYISKQKKDEWQEKSKERAKKRRGGNEKKRRRLTFDERKKLCRDQKFYCYYCERHKSEFNKTGHTVQFDHYIPLDRGGSNHIENFVMACSDCNSKKGTQLWTRGCRKGKVRFKYDD